MKTNSLALPLLALLITASARNLFAGPETIIYQRAKELRDQNNVRQGVPPPTQPGQPSAAATPAPQPLSLTHLQTDLASFKTDSPVTADQKQKLANDIIAAAQGTKPSSDTAKKLADDMSAALALNPLPSDKRARLLTELDAVLNPAKYPQAKIDGIYADIQAIFQANGTDRKHAATIADGVKAIGAETRR
jgi:hypothetical protein